MDESIKFKNNDLFLFNTRGITLFHSIFDVLTINGSTENVEEKTKFFFGKQLKLDKRVKSNVEWVIP